MKVRWLPIARAERDAQLDYIAEQSLSASVKQEARVLEQTEALADNPFLGRPGRVEGTRELVLSRTRFIAIYRVTEVEVLIERFLHSAQDWPPRSRGRS